MEPFKALAKDEQDSVRLLAVDTCVAIITALVAKNEEEQLSQVIKPLFEGQKQQPILCS